MGYGTERGHKVLGWAMRTSGWDRNHWDGTEGTRMGRGASGQDMRNWDETGDGTGGAKRGREVTGWDTRWAMGH